MTYRLYRSKKVVRAKELDHDGTDYSAVTGKAEPFRKGDFAVRDGNDSRIVPGEVFGREWEPVEGEA